MCNFYQAASYSLRLKRGDRQAHAVRVYTSMYTEAGSEGQPPARTRGARPSLSERTTGAEWFSEAHAVLTDLRTPSAGLRHCQAKNKSWAGFTGVGVHGKCTVTASPAWRGARGQETGREFHRYSALPQTGRRFCIAFPVRPFCHVLLFFFIIPFCASWCIPSSRPPACCRRHRFVTEAASVSSP